MRIIIEWFYEIGSSLPLENFAFIIDILPILFVGSPKPKKKQEEPLTWWELFKVLFIYLPLFFAVVFLLLWYLILPFLSWAFEWTLFIVLNLIVYVIVPLIYFVLGCGLLFEIWRGNAYDWVIVHFFRDVWKNIKSLCRWLIHRLLQLYRWLKEFFYELFK